MFNKKHTKIFLILSFVAMGMYAFGFALVPIYNSLCKALNINGRVSQSETSAIKNQKVDEAREIEVQFVSTVNGNIRWKFYPQTKKIKLHPGEMKRINFYAENMTNNPMTVQAIPSITPSAAGKYLKKTECFCFQRQKLNGHEAMDMPLMFHLDNDLPKDINTITLAYTLYDVTGK